MTSHASITLPFGFGVTTTFQPQAESHVQVCIGSPIFRYVNGPSDADVCFSCARGYSDFKVVVLL